MSKERALCPEWRLFHILGDHSHACILLLTSSDGHMFRCEALERDPGATNAFIVARLSRFVDGVFLCLLLMRMVPVVRFWVPNCKQRGWCYDT